MSVSVVIPTYNVSEIAGRAIQSASEQTVPVLEIIIVDDCSTDDTVAVIKRLEETRSSASCQPLRTPAPAAPATWVSKKRKATGSPCSTPTTPGCPSVWNI